MERLFHPQFFQTEPKVCVTELSKMTQMSGKSIDAFIAQFKKMRNKCKVILPNTKYVKMAQQVLDIKLRKKF